METKTTITILHSLLSLDPDNKKILYDDITSSIFIDNNEKNFINIPSNVNYIIILIISLIIIIIIVLIYLYKKNYHRYIFNHNYTC
ncbi:unknown similar to AMEV204 [Choristoneura rosaceana entomopoxvirus 'L']|uniref:Uncharacterized protein n=1 Tax=Choristoneura rosaceana entomopoxvirus 'L' TaxID=1293539 RepID=A0ABM9QKQ1_9POXV|nr:unknown similar to AMEV204 [Choristoneura rosaceana entomopoxvirus 'L']CCU56104.1 unknown similar to AMEV204 [Choristoneura rosaceana entomopoxvirus 'L']